MAEVGRTDPEVDTVERERPVAAIRSVYGLAITKVFRMP